MYIIKVKNLSSDVLSKLSRLEGVIHLSDVIIGSNIASLDILISNSKIILPQIIETIVNTNGKFRAYNRKEATFSEVFAQLTGKESNYDANI